MVIYVIYVIYSISSGPNQFMTGPYICRPGKTLEGNKLLSWGIIYFDIQILYSCHTMITFCIRAPPNLLGNNVWGPNFPYKLGRSCASQSARPPDSHGGSCVHTVLCPNYPYPHPGK